MRSGAGRCRRSTVIRTFAGTIPTQKAAAAFAATARVRGAAAPAAGAGSTIPLPYVPALSDPGRGRQAGERQGRAFAPGHGSSCDGLPPDITGW
ncbi:hypothetical protein ACVB8X_13610 [Streptomyces sp. NRAIS4]